MAEKTISIADKPTLDKVKALLENSGYGLSALKSLLSSGNSVVKSVQRGTVKTTADGGNTTTISIAQVNPSRCLVNLEGYYSSYGNNNFLPYVISLESTKLQVGNSGGISASINGVWNFSWEVIEFY